MYTEKSGRIGFDDASSWQLIYDFQSRLAHGQWPLAPNAKIGADSLLSALETVNNPLSERRKMLSKKEVKVRQIRFFTVKRHLRQGFSTSGPFFARL